ncbi:transposase [Nonomuraea terrae]
MPETALESLSMNELPVEPDRSMTDEQLISMLVNRARSDGLQLTGESGLLQHLTKRVLESALEGEITDHLGYDRHDPAGKNSGNSRNGSRTKTVVTDVAGLSWITVFSILLVGSV